MSYTWGSSTTDANITGATIALSANLTSAAVNNSGQAATEVSLVVTYNTSATKGAKVELWRTTDGGTTYQVTADAPFAFNMPFTANTTVRSVFTVPSTISNFKVNLINLDTAQSMTACTMKSRQATN